MPFIKLSFGLTFTCCSCWRCRGRSGKCGGCGGCSGAQLATDCVTFDPKLVEAFTRSWPRDPSGLVWFWPQGSGMISITSTSQYCVTWDCTTSIDSSIPNHYIDLIVHNIGGTHGQALSSRLMIASARWSTIGWVKGRPGLFVQALCWGEVASQS